MIEQVVKFFHSIDSFFERLPSLALNYWNTMPGWHWNFYVGIFWITVMSVTYILIELSESESK